MASGVAVPYAADKPAMTLGELVAYTRKELDADAERQAKVAAGEAGELQGQTGSTLDLSHKNIHALPVEVIALIKDRVERLALSHNPQIVVPSQIVQCDRLRYLNIRWNQLKHFPEAVLQLSSLEILDISKNRIVSIPEGIKNMTSLKFLAVARNRITRLPLALGDMSSLSKLKFDENPIEFPPLDTLQASQGRMASTIESEQEKDMCQLVKRFLKAQSLRERLRTNSEEDLSESNVETPRPPRRAIMGGRFPVRPSISGIDNSDDLRLQSPKGGPPPPIPQRSHARNLSNHAPSSRRPGIAPLHTDGNDINRSRSESVASSTSIRSRRQGFVPSKSRLDPNAVSDASSLSSNRSSQASTIRPTHSRASSSISTLNGYLTANSSGEASSGAVSPIDRPVSKYGPVRRLSSLPESRHSAVQPSNTINAAKRLLFSLSQLHTPVSHVARAISDGTPQKSILERQLFSANAHVEELDRLLERLSRDAEDDQGLEPGYTARLRGNFSGETGHHSVAEREGQALKPVVLTSAAALKTYNTVVKQLRQHTRKIATVADPVYVRCLMSQIYMTMVESRNICSMLGFTMKAQAPKSTPRVSQAWSSRTVTPTQPKPVNSRRMRGATILQGMSSSGQLRSMPPPVPLNINGSRTNTMTSISAAATPRSGESFSTLPASTLPSRSNNMRSVMDETDSEEHFSHIYLKLKGTCELASQSLPHCRTEFFARQDNAESRPAHHWAKAITKCDALIFANNALSHRLKVVKVRDPGVRNQKDFWQLCDNYVKAWTDLASEVKHIANQRVDTSTVKTLMRPLHKAFKEVNKMISESPLYHQAVRTNNGYGGAQNLAPPFPNNINTAFAQALSSQNNGLRSGYVTPVPATPLSAALGPAVQATVASTPNALIPPSMDYFQVGPPTMHSGRGMHERADTVMQPAGYGRR